MASPATQVFSWKLLQKCIPNWGRLGERVSGEDQMKMSLKYLSGVLRLYYVLRTEYHGFGHLSNFFECYTYEPCILLYADPIRMERMCVSMDCSLPPHLITATGQEVVLICVSTFSHVTIISHLGYVVTFLHTSVKVWHGPLTLLLFIASGSSPLQ